MTRRTAHPAVDRSRWTVEDTMFRALAVLRVLVLVNMLALNAYRWKTSFDRPGAAFVALALITAWTGFAVWAYDDASRRRPPLLVADLVVSVAAILVTPYVKVPNVHATLPGFWVMGAVLAWALHWHWRGGLAAAAVVTLADLSVRVEVVQTTYSNIFLLILGGLVVGYCTGLLKEMAAARDHAEREAAVAAERARLARAVHDGVLQVLALVQRRGAELGGEAADLGRLAGEQEVALRALVQGNAAGRPAAGQGADLVPALSALPSHTVTVSAPAGPVLLPHPVVGELVAVVRACLENVDRHVGEDAPAWVLVEHLDGSVVVTVRDEGPGIPPGRLDAAYTEGRLGIRESIRGRMHDLGGTAELVSTGQGTEWELTVPAGTAEGAGSSGGVHSR